MRGPHHRRVVKALSAVLVASFLLLLAVQGVMAHASLVRADPAPGSAPSDAPERVTLWFAEPVEPKFSEIRVLDSAGVQVDNGDTAVLESNPKAISVSLKLLRQGVYTVVWRNVSTLDGHPLGGRYTFAVGQEAVPGQPGIEQAPLLQSPIEPILRWLSLLGSLALLGGFGFYLLVAAPALRRYPDLLQVIMKRVRALNWAAIAVLAAAETGRLLLQASVLYEIPIWETLGIPAIRTVADTQWGALWLGRIVLLGITALLILTSAAWHGERKDSGWWLALTTASVLLATFSLSSHGSALSGLRVPGTVTDYLHLLAAAFWVGGLFHLLLGISVFYAIHPMDRQEILPALIPRFSTIAALSVGVLIVTGLYSAWALAGTVLPAYTGTLYGRSLIAKIAMIAPLLILAALNLIWVSRGLSHGHTWRFLRPLVLGETVLAVLALFTVSLLTTIEPARPVAAREGLDQQSRVVHITTQDKHIFLAVDPGKIGDNWISVLFTDLNGDPIDDADVTVRLSFTGADVGAMDLPATPQGEGAYSVEDVALGIAGQWEMDLTIRSRGSFDFTTSLKLDIRDDASLNSGTAPQSTGIFLFGVELALLGFLFQGTGLRLGGWRNRAGQVAIGVGSVAVLSGIFLMLSLMLTVTGGPPGL